MNAERIIWAVIFVIAGAFIIWRAGLSEHGMAKAYMKVTEKTAINIAGPDQPDAWVDIASDRAEGIDPATLPDTHRRSWTTYDQASYTDFLAAEKANPNQSAIQFSIWRTFGVWLAAFFTLAIFSFVYRDNPFYKLAESIFVGTSAAYWMVVGFWTVIIPNLLGKLWPGFIKSWALPGLEGRDLEPEYLYYVPLALGIMLVWRLAPRGGWIARWPLAFIIGVFCGLRLVSFLHADFLSQIRNSIEPLVVLDAAGAFDVWDSLRNVFLVLGVLCCLVYFFFSLEHKGVVGKTARVGIWVLMITFGAGFGYTVMGRIALLAIRLEFLFDDWLWLIDPTGKRMVAAAAAIM